MVTRTSEAEWQGDLNSGGGTIRFGSGAYHGPYTFKSRIEPHAGGAEGAGGGGAGSASRGGTNPEELIAAAHAGCFTMALSAELTKAGHPPRRLHTTAKVHLDKVPAGFEITRIELQTEGDVPGIEPGRLNELADAAKRGCPVSKALAGPRIELQATLAR